MATLFILTSTHQLNPLIFAALINNPAVTEKVFGGQIRKDFKRIQQTFEDIFIWTLSRFQDWMLVFESELKGAAAWELQEALHRGGASGLGGVWKEWRCRKQKQVCDLMWVHWMCVEVCECRTWSKHTDLVQCFLRDPAQVDVIMARGSHFHLWSWTPPLCTHTHTHTKFYWKVHVCFLNAGKPVKNTWLTLFSLPEDDFAYSVFNMFKSGWELRVLWSVESDMNSSYYF